MSFEIKKYNYLHRRCDVHSIKPMAKISIFLEISVIFLEKRPLKLIQSESLDY